MTKKQAHELLDLARQDHTIPVLEITKALWITGDLKASLADHEENRYVRTRNDQD